ncbi:MAG: signal peptidase I [Rhodothermales bacterium]
MSPYEPKRKSVAQIPIQEVANPVWPERRAILWEWAIALLLAFVAALLIRALLFEAFRIPSESMEETLLVGDFVLVSKLHYGARLPVTVGLPFTNLYLENVGLPTLRMPAFSSVKRNDVIVFNVPTESAPIDRKTHYIKRVIGLPGDTLSIIDKVPYIGSEALEMKPKMKQMWLAKIADGATFPMQRLKDLGVYQIVMPQRRGDPISFEATAERAAEVAEWTEIDKVESMIRNSSLRTRIFPYDSNFGFDNYGPLYIPKAGDTIQLNPVNWDRYKAIINQYEGHKGRELDDNTYQIDGEAVTSYMFEQNYYFAMGDNRDSSLDSRAWGFVPEDHLVGKALFVYFSWNPVLDKVRSERFFSKIK